MTAVAIALILGAVIVAVGLTVRFVPPLADTREGRLVFWIAANLAGAAAGVAVAIIWTAARTLSSSYLPSGLPTESVVVSALEEILVEGGIIIALATVVYLLGPRDRQDEHGAPHSRV
jgi:predicted phage tail protein